MTKRNTAFNIHTSVNLLIIFPLFISQIKTPCLAVAPHIQLTSPTKTGYMFMTSTYNKLVRRVVTHEPPATLCLYTNVVMMLQLYIITIITIAIITVIISQ